MAKPNKKGAKSAPPISPRETASAADANKKLGLLAQRLSAETLAKRFILACLLPAFLMELLAKQLRGEATPNERECLKQVANFILFVTIGAGILAVSLHPTFNIIRRDDAEEGPGGAFATPMITVVTPAPTPPTQATPEIKGLSRNSAIAAALEDGQSMLPKIPTPPPNARPTNPIPGARPMSSNPVPAGMRSAVSFKETPQPGGSSPAAPRPTPQPRVVFGPAPQPEPSEDEVFE
jgi:hypothetical protein